MSLSESKPTSPGLGYLLCDDMIFTSRITGTARDLGLQIKAVRNQELLQALVRAQAPDGILLDLGNQGLVLNDFIEFLRENCEAMPRLVAYGSHVDAAGLRAAREAGCDVVLPRSRFVEDLASSLAEWVGG